MSEAKQSVLVIGAGIAGISAALEAAETGAEVVLVERDPSVGGRVTTHKNYFRKCARPRAVWRSISAASSATRGSAC